MSIEFIWQTRNFWMLCADPGLKGSSEKNCLLVSSNAYDFPENAVALTCNESSAEHRRGILTNYIGRLTEGSEGFSQWLIRSMTMTQSRNQWRERVLNKRRSRLFTVKETLRISQLQYMPVHHGLQHIQSSTAQNIDRKWIASPVNPVNSIESGSASLWLPIKQDKARWSDENRWRMHCK